MNSEEQRLYKDTMAHVDNLQQYAYRKAAQLEVEPELSPMYVNDQLDSFVLRAFTTRARSGAAIPRARVMQTPIDGENTYTLQLKHDTEPVDEAARYEAQLFGKKRHSIDESGTYIVEKEVLKQGQEIDGWLVHGSEDVVEFLESVQKLRTEHLQVSPDRDISFELKKQLASEGLESVKTIFETQGFLVDKRMSSQTIDFRVGQQHPLNVSVQFVEPLYSEDGGDFHALMTTTTEIEGDDVALTYDVKLNDTQTKPFISAEIALLGLRGEKVSVGLPGELRFLNDALKNLAANAELGRLRKEFDAYTYDTFEDLESMTAPRTVFEPGIDLYTLIASIYETSLK